MKTQKLILGFVMLVSIALHNGCKKPEKGDTGPQGPAGTNGQNGQDGNANVKSGSLDISSWTISAPNYYADISYTAITQDIIDNGAVITYLSENGGFSWTQLPLTIYPSSSYSRTYEPMTYIGGVRIWVSDSDLTQTPNPGTMKFKIVAIAASGIKKLSDNNGDLNNYNQVRQLLGL